MGDHVHINAAKCLADIANCVAGLVSLKSAVRGGPQRLRRSSGVPPRFPSLRTHFWSDFKEESAPIHM